MHLLRAGLTYFAIAFSAGFALGAIRVPLLVPRLGMRTAELLEMPVMLVVIVWAARFNVYVGMLCLFALMSALVRPNPLP